MTLFKDDYSTRALTSIPFLFNIKDSLECILYKQGVNDNLIGEQTIIPLDDKKILKSYVLLFKELNEGLPEGIELLIMSKDKSFSILLLDKNHSEIIAGLNDLVKKTGYGITSEYAYSSGFVFYKQGMGVLMNYDEYDVDTNNIYKLKKRLNNEFEKMEVLVNIYNFKIR